MTGHRRKHLDPTMIIVKLYKWVDDINFKNLTSHCKHTDIDTYMHQNRSISLFPAPFDLHPFPALIRVGGWVLLRSCHRIKMVISGSAKIVC